MTKSKREMGKKHNANCAGSMSGLLQLGVIRFIGSVTEVRAHNKQRRKERVIRNHDGIKLRLESNDERGNGEKGSAFNFGPTSA